MAPRHLVAYLQDLTGTDDPAAEAQALVAAIVMGLGRVYRSYMARQDIAIAALVPAGTASGRIRRPPPALQALAVSRHVGAIPCQGVQCVAARQTGHVIAPRLLQLDVTHKQLACASCRAAARNGQMLQFLTALLVADPPPDDSTTPWPFHHPEVQAYVRQLPPSATPRTVASAASMLDDIKEWVAENDVLVDGGLAPRVWAAYLHHYGTLNKALGRLWQATPRNRRPTDPEYLRRLRERIQLDTPYVPVVGYGYLDAPPVQWGRPLTCEGELCRTAGVGPVGGNRQKLKWRRRLAIYCCDRCATEYAAFIRAEKFEVVVSHGLHLQVTPLVSDAIHSLPPECDLTPKDLAGVLPPPLHGLNPNSDHVAVVRAALAHAQGRLPQARANLINAVHWVLSPGLPTPLPRAPAGRKGHPTVYRLPHPVTVRFEFKCWPIPLINTGCIDAAITNCGRITYRVQFRDGDRAHYTLREITSRVIGRVAGQSATDIQEHILYPHGPSSAAVVPALPSPPSPSMRPIVVGSVVAQYMLGEDLLDYRPSGFGTHHCPHAHRVVVAHPTAPHCWYLVPLTAEEAHPGHRRGVWARLEPGQYAEQWVHLNAIAASAPLSNLNLFDLSQLPPLPPALGPVATCSGTPSISTAASDPGQSTRRSLRLRAKAARFTSLPRPTPPRPRPLLLPRKRRTTMTCWTAPPGAIPIILHQVLPFLSPGDVVRALSSFTSSATCSSSVVVVLTTPRPPTGSRRPLTRRSPPRLRSAALSRTPHSASTSVLVSPHRAHRASAQNPSQHRRCPPRSSLPPPKRVHLTRTTLPPPPPRAPTSRPRRLHCPGPLSTCILLYAVLPPPLDRFLRTHPSVHSLVASYCGVPSLLQPPAARLSSSAAAKQRRDHNAPT